MARVGNVLSIGVWLTVVVALQVSVVSAQEGVAGETKKQRDLPKSGTLSTSISTGSVASQIPGVWGGVNAMGDDPAPIAGSVSRSSANSWEMKIFNQSEDTYSVNLAVIQTNDRGSQVRSDSFSYTLKPKQSESRSLPAGTGAVTASLDLRSFKNLSEKKRLREEAMKAGAGAPNTESDSASVAVQ